MCPFCVSTGIVVIGGVVSAGGLGVWLANRLGAGKKDEARSEKSPRPEAGDVETKE